MNMTVCTNPLTDAISGMSSGAYSTIAYLLLSFRSSPPLNQETVALGEACGRHSKTTSPPLWITVDFFTGRRVKSGGEAEEQTHVKAICLALWTGQQLRISQNVKCITSNYGNYLFTSRLAYCMK